MIKVPSWIVSVVSTEFVKLTGRAGLSVKAVPTVKDIEAVLKALVSVFQATGRVVDGKIDVSEWIE